MSIDPDTLMAFVDGELAADARVELERAIAGDPALRDEVEAQRRLKTRLVARYGPVASEAVPEHLLAIVGGAKVEGVAGLAAARERRAARFSWRNFGAIAASLAVGLLAGQFVASDGGGPSGVADRSLVAGDALARALDSQLASTQPADSPTRIGLTFADRRGRACRTFETRAFAGLACRRGERWALVATEASDEAGAHEYRQAGSSLVMEKAQEMMAGAPLDSEGERRAMRSGWRMASEAKD